MALFSLLALSESPLTPAQLDGERSYGVGDERVHLGTYRKTFDSTFTHATYAPLCTQLTPFHVLAELQTIYELEPVNRAFTLDGKTSKWLLPRCDVVVPWIRRVQCVPVSWPEWLWCTYERHQSGQTVAHLMPVRRRECENAFCGESVR